MWSFPSFYEVDVFLLRHYHAPSHILIKRHFECPVAKVSSIILNQTDLFTFGGKWEEKLGKKNEPLTSGHTWYKYHIVTIARTESQ